jgi:lipoprotein-anchoring transpeptidase ErfK/SrfK
VKKFLVFLFGFLVAVSFFTEESSARANHSRFHHKVHKYHVKRRRPPPPPPVVVAQINVSSQTMSVNVDGWPEGYWQVSTASGKYHTPRGSFRVQRMARVYYSKKYDNSPMPNSVFFSGGIAIHGTYHVRQLGLPVSHGCVRLDPYNAARFYELVEEYGASRTRIIVTD